MKFLNLETGYSFDGLWTENQSKGYTFWFPNEQSIDIVYTMPIAAITDTDTPLQITVEDNDIFSIISHTHTETAIDGYIFDGQPIYSNTFVTTPELIGTKYIHVFNVACCGQNAGEYVCRINIGDEGYIRVGADLYGEHEAVYINLSNMGIEIPEGVQKAIYDSNVHEDLKDNILINRKFKELMSNYWDIVANKGSYKSLSNSLEWFEWDNLLKIKEIIKHSEANRTIFSDRDILSVFEDKVENTFNNFAKTTYISLYCSLQDELPTYDNEYNPELMNAVLKWTRNDIQLKIALLAQFFGIYFMPIHMSVLHAVAEDKVFTNTIKAIHGVEVKRDDCFGSFDYVECNIKDNTVFKMDNVRAQVSTNTVFGCKYPSTAVFGVDVFPKKETLTESDAQTFSTQYYTGPGAIIPIKLVIPNQNQGDFVKHTVIDYTQEDGTTNRLFLYDIFKVQNNSVSINFNFLVKSARDYTIKFTFVMGSSKTITKVINFTVEDADNLNINIYKVRSKDDTDGLTKSDFSDTACSKYIFRIQNGHIVNPYYKQYLPYMLPTNIDYSSYKGIKLTRTIVVDLQNNNGLGHVLSDAEILFLRSIMMNDYLEFAKYKHDESGNAILDDNGKPMMSYLIFVSKYFYAEAPAALHTNVYGYDFNIIRNDLGFYPQFHYLEKMDGNSIENYTISPYEALCCAAEINTGNGPKEFRYGHMIDTAEWSFYNHLTNDTVYHPLTSQKPFVATSNNTDMKPGYYDVSFKYSLTNGISHECRLDSAFRIK